MKQLGAQWNSVKFDTGVFFKNLPKKICIKSFIKILQFRALYMKTFYFYFISRSILLRMENFLDKIYRENKNTISFSTVFFFENRAVYE
jgi:hypothetical protein